VAFATDPERLELPGIVQLQQLLGLTSAEARVATATVQGGTNRDVANTLSISEETVRAPCKSIYSKIHIGDKASLTRVPLSLGKAIA
jgi:DNA-binding CsgD family transcriptional regulator